MSIVNHAPATPSAWSASRRCLTGLLLFGSFTLAQAALTDLADAPFFNSTSSLLKPNVMLLMDTSNSMRFSHMPDEIEGSNSGFMPIGYKSYQCNALYYNPNQAYVLPKDGSGNALPTPNFNAARYNYYSADETTVNLATSFRAYDTTTRQFQTVADPAQPAYYYVHSVAGAKNYLAAPCTDLDQGVTVAASDNSGTWTRVIVSATSGPGGTDERQNFATWYTYYRTRINLSKSAVSLAFSALNDSYRVGLITVKPDLSGTANYLPIADFNSTQRSAWYEKLFNQVPGGSSPSREALARVGRHYAGKQDGINTGMTGDPVQYSCQQNFTIMTTDGYWNTAAETVGPVGLDGTTLVGQQDGTLTDAAGWTPRPIWDGGTDSSRAITDQMWQYQSVACASPYANLSTARLLRSTLQNLESTSQTTMSTSQRLRSTVRHLRSTEQNLSSRSQNLQNTSQVRQSTVQNLESTSQQLQSTSQIQRTSSQSTITTRRTTASTVQILESTNQVVKNTSQKQKSTTQILKSTVQNLQSTNQILRSTVQNLASTTQILKSTVQNLQSTSRVDVSTVAINKLTTQHLAYDAATELTTPVASCTAGGTISCSTVTTGPILVSSCTPATANAGNLYTTTTCETTSSGPTPASSCSAASASASNNYTTTTCTPVTTSNVPVASCTPQTASAGNGWTTTTCGTANVTTNQPAASCTAGTAGASAPIPYLVTTCPAPITTTNVPVASCTAQTASASNNYVTRTCPSPNVTTNVGVASCTPSSATASNNWTTTTCPTPVNTSNVPVASCTPQTASSTNAWVNITCSTANVTTNVPVASCTAGTASATATIPYLVTTCPTPNTTSNVPVLSCTNSSASSSNNYTTTTCATVVQTNIPTQTCTAQSASSANNYTATTCPAPLTTSNVPVASCTAQTAALSNNWLTRTCPTPITTTNVPVDSCTPQTAASTNNFVTRTCTGPTILSGPTVGSCTVAAPSSSNNYIETLCGSIDSTTGVSSCTAQTASSSNNWTTITCNTVTTSNVPVASCTAQTASSSNNWLAITCGSVVTSNVPVASCTPQTASSSNNWITRTCPTPNTTTDVPVASCTPQTASSSNSWLTRSCNTLTTSNVPVASCTAQSASVGNNWTTTSCPSPIVVTNQPQAAVCVPQTASALNQWTTITCPAPVITTNVPVTGCTPAEPTLANNYVRVTCSTDNVTTDVPVASCTEGIDATLTNVSCQVVNALTNSPVASCTPATANADNNYTTVSCATNTTTNQPVASCTPQTAALANNWLTRTCPPPAVTTDQPVASCSPQAPSASNNYTLVTCAEQNSAPSEVASCTPNVATAGNGWTTTSCSPLPGHMLQRRLRTSQSTVSLSGGTIAGQTSPVNTDGAWTNVDGICHPDASTLAPPLGPVPADVRATATEVVPPSGCSEWPCSVETTSAQGSQNSLADVAQYYYVTDLRPDMENNVRVKGSGPEEDRATHQHMTTFTLALGVSGTLNYSPTYKLDAVGDFARIRCNPVTGACNNTCPSTDPSYPNCTAKRWPLWPDPAINYSADGSLYSNPRSIDDFWHTAVNGRGQYFSANDPVAVVDGLQKALAGVLARLGAGSAATVSSVEPVAGSNFVYRASFITEEWVGDIKANTIEPETGVISSSPVWSAQSLLDGKIGVGCDRRTIYLFRQGATDNLTPFTYNTRICDAGNQPTGDATTGLNATEQAYFGADSIAQLSQYVAMSDGSNGTVDQRSAAAGANLVNFLRGHHNLEGPTLFRSNDLTTLFRSRTHALGDIVGSQPVYIGPPGAAYGDNGYASFKTANASRATVIYAGANDGMLHAFNASSGEELWAYIPRLVLSRLFKLADNNYANAHQFYVDGNPSVADIDVNAGTVGSPEWKTILVGGLNKGGKGYYALDVTDPAHPKALWEFGWSSTCWDNASVASGDCHVGYSYGRPIISKLQDGRWVVMVSSGMNNVNSPSLTGDGQGYLYILNAANGTLIAKISTGAGSAATPSGLAHLTNFVDNQIINNTSLRVYGGDLLGNIWRFDINDNLAPPGREAILLGTATAANGTPQPISTRLELGEIDGKPWIFAGTGRLWGVSDLLETQQQSLYAIRDPLTGSPVYDDLRGSLNLMQFTQVGSGAGAYRTTACAGTCTGTNGWVIDLPDAGERVNIAPQLQLGTVVFLSNVPSTSVCSTGGYGWVNFFNFRTGLAVVTSTDQATSRRFDATIAVGGTIIRTTDKKVRDVVRGADDTQNVPDIPNAPSPPAGKRVSWREIID
ncbi:MAG: PQQ-binding-like beta-propeller repeat protein [Candidatus Accumulibacter sp.]|nr:PQQ-binding-like beta-propeller repeat protein [Accumulibacter sp.]